MSTYTLLDEIMASPVEPLAQEKQDYHLGRIRQALLNMERAPEPSYDDWKVLSTAVNMMESLILLGELQDPDGLHPDAMSAMAVAGTRHATTGAAIRLTGTGIQSLRALTEDYAEVVAALPARTMIRAFRKTEKAVQKLYGSKTKRKSVKL